MLIAFIVLAAIVLLWSLWGYFTSHVEQTVYTVVKKTSTYEIREYPAHIVAQTTVPGSLDASMNAGFSIVAGYIFGNNKKKENIAMTAPVIARTGSEENSSTTIAMTAPVIATNSGESHTISFGMPASYTLDTLPTPLDPRVELVMIPTKYYAVKQFSWYRTDTRIKQLQEELLANLTHDGIVAKGSPAYAGYNAPGTPPWMTRNEVMVEITY